MSRSTTRQRPYREEWSIIIESADETLAKGQDRTSPEHLRVIQETRSQAARLALVSTAVLTAFKLFVGVISGSVSVLSEGIHSLLDLVSAAIAFVTVRLAGRPADLDHPFGHGKFETVSSIVEAALLLAAALFIFFEALEHLFNPQPLKYEWVAIGTIFVSLFISYYVYRNNSRAAEITESSAIHVNALHFLSDVVTSLAVLVGLILIKLTGWVILDVILAAGVGTYILVISFKQIRRGLGELVDAQLPDEEIQLIRGLLDGFQDRVIGMHDVRTRRSGAYRHIDFHLVVCGRMSVNDSHAICDEMEEAIQTKYPQSLISIHVEPCSNEKLDCRTECQFQKKRNSL